MEKIEEKTCIKFEERTRNHHEELVFSLLCWTVCDKKSILILLQIKPRERTISNLKMETAAILWLDEMVKNRQLFYLNVVPKNIHSSTRFISSLKERCFKDKIFRFYMLLVYIMSISDQIEMNISMLIWYVPKSTAFSMLFARLVFSNLKSIGNCRSSEKDSEIVKENIQENS